jgi:rod shape determining protein RodA
MERRIWHNFDMVLLMVAVVLVGIGLATIHSATLDPDNNGIPLNLTNLWEDFVFRQAIYAVASLAILFVVARIDYRFFKGTSHLIYTLGLLLLVLLFAWGQVYGGAQSWFDLYLFPLQPSELIKVFLILVLAQYFAAHQEEITNIGHLFISLLIVALPMGLVYLQPDLGTAIILGGIWLGMAWMAGLAMWQFGLMTVGGVLAAPGVWFQLEPYMQRRILTFLNPGRDPSGDGYNVMQALISIGSGGLTGKGFGHGTQSQLHFLRVRHTDYIFSVFAEEFGFVGSIALLALLLFMLLRILRAARIAQDDYGRLVAGGVGMMIFCQVFINLGVNLSLLPATGLPLPFISYGGSSLFTMMIGLGLVESVVMRHRKLEFE